MTQRKASFLDLPLEIREQVYHLVLQPSMLCTRRICESEWLRVKHRDKGIASLLFTSKQVYREAAPIFYSKATLEITPAQRDLIDPRTIRDYIQQHENDHAFCPTWFLGEIRNIHIYSDQSFVIEKESYQALFQWLVAKTAATHIYLSQKTMGQRRHTPELIDLTNLIYDTLKQPKDVRVIDIYARIVSGRLRCSSNDRSGFHGCARPLPGIQIYLNSPLTCQPYLYREPRWDLLLSESSEANDHNEVLTQEMQRFANTDLEHAYLRQAHIGGYLWLYQSIQIQRRPLSAAG